MPSGFFRPCRRSSMLLVIVALGAMMSGPTTRAEPPAERVSPRSVEFEGVQDRVPLGFRDYAALVALSKQARTGLTADLIKAARHDVGLGELLNQSAGYRGELIELRGLARRRYSALELGGRKGLLEVWITVPTEGVTPFACVLEKLPEGFPRREDISEPVVFRGFFLKVITYLAGDVWREAPLLVGRMETLPDRQVAGPPPAGPNNRLPSASAFENGLWLTEDRIPIEFVYRDRLIVDGQPVARGARRAHSPKCSGGRPRDRVRGRTPCSSDHSSFFRDSVCGDHANHKYWRCEPFSQVPTPPEHGSRPGRSAGAGSPPACS